MNRRLLIVSIIILLFAAYLNAFPLQQVVPLRKAFDDFPLNWNGWQGKVIYFDEAIMDKLNVSEYIMRQYRRGTDKIDIYVGYYKSQKKDAQIHSPKQCLPGGGWLKLSERTRALDIDGENISFVEAVYQKGTDKEIFLYWYKMKDKYITNEYVLKYYMVLNSLKYRRNDAAFIRFSTPVDKTIDDSLIVIESAVSDFVPMFSQYLPD
jgi:EpsI family protein